MVIEEIDKIVGMFNDLMKEIAAVLETLKKEDIGDILEKEPELLKRLFDIGEGMDNLPKMIKDGIDIINESMEAFTRRYDELKQAVDEAGELGINFELSDVPIGFYLEMKEGKISIGLGELEEPTLMIKAEMPTIIKLLTGELDGMEAFISEKIAIEGSAGEAMKILPLQEFMKQLRG
ncbi:MAG: SCP-2 sterol transfer family protein [Candidatus Methanolliviera sp. GoM_asphalt]|nr:MAG: SCP-2 sterol transfer family protein [Candidatus Methanolliviera sp. GoM_asphalt]